MLNNTHKIEKYSILVIVIGVVIRIPLILETQFYRLDTWRQTDTASIAHNFLINGYKILYPQVFWGGNGPGYVETEFQLYPFIVSIFYSIFGEYVWLGRLVSFSFTAFTIIGFCLFAKQVLKPREAFWSLFFFTLSPLLLRYSASFMPEATVMCFYVGALYFFSRWMDEYHDKWLILASLFATLAILIKPTSIHIVLLFLLLALNRFDWKIMVKNWRIWLAAIICLLPAIFYYWHARNLYLGYGNTFGAFSGGDSKFGNIQIWTSPQFYIGIAKMEAKWVLTPLGSLVILLGLYISVRRHQFLLLFSLITLGLYFLILARYTGYIRGLQYHVYMIPYAALGFGIGIEALLDFKRRILGKVLFIITILSVLGWAIYCYQEMVRTPEPESMLTCARFIKQLIPKDDYIIVSTYEYSTDIEFPGIPNNYQEPMLFYYSKRYGWSLPVDWLNPDKIEGYRRKGASYYVILVRDEYLLEPNKDVLDYLRINATQVGSGFEKGCMIYHFNK